MARVPDDVLVEFGARTNARSIYLPITVSCYPMHSSSSTSRGQACGRQLRNGERHLASRLPPQLALDLDRTKATLLKQWNQPTADVSGADGDQYSRTSSYC